MGKKHGTKPTGLLKRSPLRSLMDGSFGLGNVMVNWVSKTGGGVTSLLLPQELFLKMLAALRV
jgi:hypothetical protein